jgi:hypothetical protein
VGHHCVWHIRVLVLEVVMVDVSSVAAARQFGSAMAWLVTGSHGLLEWAGLELLPVGDQQ